MAGVRMMMEGELEIGNTTANGAGVSTSQGALAEWIAKKRLREDGGWSDPRT